MKGYEETYWKATISKCPHCDVIISVESESIISKRTAIGMSISKVEDHIKNRCPLRMRIKSKRPTRLSIMIKSKNESRVATEWETDQVLI